APGSSRSEPRASGTPQQGPESRPSLRHWLRPDRFSRKFFSQTAETPLSLAEPGIYCRPDAGSGPVLQRRPREITGPADGGPPESQRHPVQAGPAEARPQGEQGQDPDAADGSAGVRPDRQGDRHADGGSQVRPGEDEPDPESVPDLAVEDHRRSVRAPARGTRFAAAQVALRPWSFSRPSRRS